MNVFETGKNGRVGELLVLLRQSRWGIIGLFLDEMGGIGLIMIGESKLDSFEPFIRFCISQEIFEMALA